jgi:L-threonylcarbamoyladenylate synthase
VPLLPATSDNLDLAAALLRGGGVVAFPTETVYGLGANAFDAAAVARVFEIKGRPSFDPLIVHVGDEAMLDAVAEDVSQTARRLIERFWPGPLTIVLPRRAQVPAIVTSGLATVAVRMPSHPVARALLSLSGVPLAAPSANPFGYLSPTRAEHVERMLGARVDAVIDGGAPEHGIESTIVLAQPVATLLRHGAVPVEAIEEVIGPLARELGGDQRPLAPGQFASHYAPRTPIRVLQPDSPVADRQAAGLLAYRESSSTYAACCVLSPGGGLREAAARLFECLHDLDVPEEGLGRAIMDRLRRAQHG